MGGFTLLDGEQLHTLLPNELIHLTENHDVELPSITEKEISDKSKGDALSKGLVVLQTGWFALQCLARKTEGLPLVELEIVTLAYVIASFVIYGLWWNKPLDVQCPVPVRRSPPTQTRTEIEAMEGKGDRVLTPGERAGDILLGMKGDNTPGSCIIRDSIRILWDTPSQATSTKGRRHSKRGKLVSDFTVRFLEVVYFGSVKAIGTVDKPRGRVSTFYSGPVDDRMRWIAGITAMLVAVIFGVFHCMAWSSQFPAQHHQQLWRACSVIIISVPALIPLSSLFAILYRRWAAYPLSSQMNGRMRRLHGVLLTLAVALYFFARITLVTQAFFLLKSLPPDAFRTMSWTTFIPHL